MAKKNKLSLQSEGKLKAKARSLSIKEGSSYSVTDGLGFRYITPYALSLGASNAHIGFLTSIPSLLGNFVQLETIKAMGKYSRKKICFWGALIQGLLWLPVIALGIFYFFFNLQSSWIPTLLVAFYTLMILAGGMISPAWYSWMRDLIIPKESGHYFGRRNRIIGLVALICIVVAGLTLEYFKGKLQIIFIFSILFLLAMAGRLFSAYFFRQKYEPSIKLEKSNYFTLRQFVKKLPQTNYGHFTIFLSLIYLMVYISSPFFVVFMFKELNFNYLQYMLVIVSSSLAGLLFMPAWGKFADRYGNFNVIRLCSYIIPFVPLTWLFSLYLLKNHPQLVLPYIFIFEFFFGAVWAGFNLASSNFIYDCVRRQKIPLCVSYTNILCGIGIFIGASLGGIISSLDFKFFGFSALVFIFLLSGITRLLISLTFVRWFKEVKEVCELNLDEAKEKLSSLTPEHVLMYLDLKLTRVKPPHN